MGNSTVLDLSRLKNPDNLKGYFLDPLGRYLGRLLEHDEVLARRTLRHVVDGGEDEVVLTLAGRPEAATVLLISPRSGTGLVRWELQQLGGKERAAIFHNCKAATPAVWGRLSQVLDAVVRATGATPQVPEGCPTWLKLLLLEIVSAWSEHGRGSGSSPTWSLADLEAILQWGDLPANLLARTFLDGQASRLLAVNLGYYHYYAGSAHQAFLGWDEYLSRNLDLVRASLTRNEADQRLHVVRRLLDVKFDCTPVLDLLVEAAAGPSKTVREAILPLLAGHREGARPHLERVLVEGDAAARNEAAQLLWRLCERSAVETLQARLPLESSARVKQTLEKLLAAPAEGADAANLAESLPPVQIALGEVPLPEEAKAGLRQFFHEGWQQAQRHYEEQLARWNAPDRPRWMSQPVKPEPVSEATLGQLINFTEGRAQLPERWVIGYTHGRTLGDWLAPPGVQLIHVVRLAFALNFLNLRSQNNEPATLAWGYSSDLEAYRGRCKEPFGLREVDTAVATLPRAPGMLAWTYLDQNSSYRSFCDWEPEAVWPFFAEHPEVLREALAPSTDQRSYWYAARRPAAFKVLAKFPQLPGGFIPLIWDIALGETKGERPLAQAALARVPALSGKIVVALGDGKQGTRAVAAEWLGKIGDRSAIEPLTKTFRAEKSEVVKGAVMNALEALGADVNEFLDRKTLLAEAEAGLKKKRPRGMEWVPLATLPALHWQDTGELVDPPIVQWWLVQGIQQKSPAGGPLLRRYLGMCRTHEAETLARFVLSAWIARDTAVRPQEEAAQMARTEADRRWVTYSSHAHFAQHYKNDKENLYRQLFQEYSTQFQGSAVGEKGLLGVVAAAGDGQCVKMCEAYIRKYFGTRLAQCKVMVELLGWMKHPLAIQVLLSLSNRFRTLAIRKLAGEHVKALADREGWTIDELADRTIPDAGFERPVDEQGEPVGDRAQMVLDYGPRQFTVTLSDELEPIVTTSEGKVIKAPPAPGKTDDIEKAKPARKAFADAKKLVKEVVKRQTERFYESLCTQRTWRLEEWRRYLASHPIAGRLCVRLAWVAFAPGNDSEPEKFLGCFRPLEDGSLTNECDEEMVLEEGTLIRLAHTCNTPDELGAAWLQHFKDYDVTPLFEQFGRATYTLPEEKKKETEIKDFEGYQISTFKLRGRATKLGYLRGDSGDGGWFTTYRKLFHSLEIQAVLEFTGNSLPEEDRPGALESLSFLPLKGEHQNDTWSAAALPLGKVPPVLLSEVYNDIRQMAADGPGYDAEWRKKSYY